MLADPIRLLINKAVSNLLQLFFVYILLASKVHGESFTLAKNSVEGTITIVNASGSAVSDRSDVVIFIDGVESSHQFFNNPEIPVMSHLGKIFSPHVMPIVKGSTVDFFNDDNIFHNVFSLSKIQPFDLGIYPKGSSKLVKFNQPGLIKIYCHIHPRMVSNILVLNNPFHSKTDVNGKFFIEGIPDGKYFLRVWFEYGKSLSQEIEFIGGKKLIKDFTLKITKKIRKHKNKFGKAYREKY